MAKYKSDLPCEACGCDKENSIVLHHVKSRGSGGSDSPRNLLSLCSSCHANIHSIGLRRFAETHTNVRTWLLKNGWEHMEHFQRWINPDV